VSRLDFVDAVGFVVVARGFVSVAGAVLLAVESLDGGTAGSVVG
jgi:hypothetical protein